MIYPTCFRAFGGALIIAAALGTTFAQAQDRPVVHKDGATLGGRGYRSLTVEMTYVYSVTPYSPAYAVKLVDQKGASYATPEDALIANLSSLAATNFAWNNQTWTAASVRDMEQRDRADGTTPRDWETRWKTLYAGKRFDLLNRIDYGRYVLIEYRVSGAPGGKPMVDTAALAKDGQQWKVTQELAADPILQHWNSPQRRVQMAPNSMFSK